MADSNATEIIANLRLEKAKFKAGLIARNTVLGYTYDLKMYETWCERFDLTPLPSAPETLALYLTFLLTEGKKITTARRRKCAIVHAHRSRGLSTPASSEISELLMGAQRLRAEKPRQMRPISVPELRKMSADLARIGTAVAMRDRALLVVGFASALRRSNLVALMMRDIEFCRQGLTIRVEREKQDQEGKGRLIAIERGRHANTDPVRVLKDWLRLRGRQDGPLFPRLTKHRRGAHLDGQCLLRIVKNRLAAIGVDPVQSGAHSLRAGTVTTLGEHDVGILRIGAFTGQSAETVRKYFRRHETWRNSPCRSLGL